MPDRHLSSRYEMSNVNVSFLAALHSNYYAVIVIRVRTCANYIETSTCTKHGPGAADTLFVGTDEKYSITPHLHIGI